MWDLCGAAQDLELQPRVMTKVCVMSNGGACELEQILPHPQLEM